MDDSIQTIMNATPTPTPGSKTGHPTNVPAVATTE